MPISSPLPNDTRSKTADWLEILCLCSARGLATKADLLGIYDVLGDPDDHELEADDTTGEPLEEEILEDRRAELADDILDELQYRSDTLKDQYPFELRVRGQQWQLLPSAPSADLLAMAGRRCYVFCLLNSAIRDKSIRGKDITGRNETPVERAMADHFQVISAEAAADFIGGDVISFGWPRPGGTAFQPALKDVSQKLALGKPLETVPLWASGREKDAGIDVIAWRDFVDFRPGKLILLGQVASGNNWKGKSVESDTSHFFSWFSERPTKHYIPAIFIPFPQHHECQGKKNEEFEAVAAAQAWLREQEFGLVLDRLRIIGHAARRLTRHGYTHGATALNEVGTWNDQVIGMARATA